MKEKTLITFPGQPLYAAIRMLYFIIIWSTLQIITGLAFISRKELMLLHGTTEVMAIQKDLVLRTM
jgi:hypothetical protein